MCGLLFGLAPIWRASRMSVRDGIAAGSTHARALDAGLWLAGVEVTAAFVLTAGALLMLQSFSSLTQTDLAFERSPAHGAARTAARPLLHAGAARDSAGAARAAAAMPGVEAA